MRQLMRRFYSDVVCYFQEYLLRLLLKPSITVQICDTGILELVSREVPVVFTLIRLVFLLLYC